MGCNMCVVQKPEEQHRVMLQVSGREGPRRGLGPEPPRGGPRGPKEPLVLQVLRRRPPPAGGAPPAALGAAAPPHPWGGPGPPPAGLVDSGTQTDISFESRLGPGRGSPGGAEPPPIPHDYFDPADLGEPERPEELEYEEVELYRASHRDKLGLTVCYRTDGEEDAGIYVGEVNPNSIAAKDGRIREGDRIIQINGVEVQDREEAVAFLTREQQTNISLLLARPESQRWKDSDREDFLDDFGSDEDGELRQRGPWTPPGQPPSPATPGPRGAEPDSGVGRTDESTRNEESSEHDLLGEEGGEGPPPPAPPPAATAPPPPRRGPPRTPPPPPHTGSSGGARPGRAGGRTGPSGGGGGSSRAGGRAGAAVPVPVAVPDAGLSPAELRRYRQLRGRVGAAGGAAELALLEEELRHLEFKCRHLLRAQKMERLRERCLRAWLEAAGAEPPLADIAEAPERDSTSAYNSGESARSARGAPLPVPVPGTTAAAVAAAGTTAKAPRGKRPGRDRLLKARAIKILEERGGSTTDDDARSELKTGRYWSREQRKQHLARAREQRRRRELLLLQARAEAGGGSAGPPEVGGVGGVGGGGGVGGAPPGARRGPRRRSRRILENWAAIQEMLARGPDGGRRYNPLLSVTTV